MGPAERAACAYSIDEMRRLARGRLPKMVFDFVDGGAEDEITRGRNEADFDGYAFRPTPLNGAAAPDLSVEVFGRRLALPLIIGPTGLSGMLWPRGEVVAARAAIAAGTVWCMSHGSTVRIEDVAKVAPGSKWFQVFLYRDRGLTRAFIERAAAAGYEALILTVDTQVLGQRERDIRNGFTIPPRIRPSHGLDLVRCLPWLYRMVRWGRRITLANYVGHVARASDIPSLSRYIEEMLDPGLSWQDVAWLRELWKGPLVLKGILHPDEARLALEHGVDGVVVSNHGGRQLDGARSAIAALPEIVDQVQGRMAVFLDGGFRRGADVVKALALGADAGLIGRPHLFGLAVAGQAGVARVLEIYRSEMARVMTLGGWASVRALDRGILERITPGGPSSLAPRRGPGVTPVAGAAD
jgi:L-lactate dehydrogenase (cytochrome)/(S)-mandelate dehydrogenase